MFTFSVQLETWVSRAGSRCFWVWVEQALHRRGCICTNWNIQPPTPLRLISVLSAMTYLRVNSFHLHQFRVYPSTASLPLCPSCPDHKLNLRGKALG